MESLAILAASPSKEAVSRFFRQGFMYRTTAVPALAIEETAAILECSTQHAAQAYASAQELIAAVLYTEVAPEEALSLLPESLDPNVSKLIVKTIYKLLPDFRQSAISTQPSLPKLEAVDWQVNIKTGSDKLHSMAVPTVLVNLQVQEEVTSTEQMPGVRDVKFELSKQSLQTLLDGLGKVRKQLDAVAV
eukprot:TRINITY_DN16433_c0_g1_i1.p1 TRINITY_DN16433_c0_g1~~TRINITY_DN16433_c0_g1_i1.p1  ORF type:complete len:190 (-),score=70.23 TRINITY_DN16433_c0_g1_i1:230-799(-)